MNRKLLRITIEVKNISELMLRNVRLEIMEKTTKIMGVSPVNVYMRDFRRGDILHQVVYIGEYSAREQFFKYRI